MLEYEFQNWLSDTESLEYFDYWNNEQEERSKAWYILDGNFSKMENHLKESGLLNHLEKSVEVLNNRYGRELEGIGADLASGTLWAVPHLLRLGNVEKIYCIEYSRHRLLKIGPKVLDYYNVPKDYVVLVLGNFYELDLPDSYLDFVQLSSAFHHADKPNMLLTEIRRVLKPDGVVMIIGEPIREISIMAYAKHICKFFISRVVPSDIQRRIFTKTFNINKLFVNSDELFPPDPVLGDHYYTFKQYRYMFSRYGFEIKHIRDDSSIFQSFVLKG